MLESIYIGMSGLTGYSQGLRVIANNTANVNTPGFKSSSLQFTDLFASGGGNGDGGAYQIGHGLGTNGTTLNFRQGELRQTGNALDLALTGDGMFTLKDSSGKTHYTRAGQFEFDSSGVLVNRADGAKVMALAGDGKLAEISIANARTSSGKASSTVSLSGNLSSTATSQTVSGVTVFDALGGEHALSLQLTNTNATSAGSWDVALMDGDTKVASKQLIFASGQPAPATQKLAFSFAPTGQGAMPLTLDFSVGVTSFASGNLSTLAMSSQDGFAPAAMTAATFDNTGTLVQTYANGQTIKGARLALGRFDSSDDVASSGGGSFDALNESGWHIGVAGTGAFGSITSGSVEISNVDLSQEFSDLVIMQRGYQASSQIISTANDMLQELFSMKGK